MLRLRKLHAHVFVVSLSSLSLSTGHAVPKPAPVAKFRPPVAERCANKDDVRGLTDSNIELWGLRRGTGTAPLFTQVSLEGVQLSDGRTLQFTLRGAQLVPQEPTVNAPPNAAPPAQNADAVSLVGAVITALGSNGSPVELTVCDAVPDPTDPELHRYNIQYLNSATNRWQNVCAGTPNQPAPRAIALPGVWDASGAHRDVPGAFTFACPRGTLTRCAEWGYKPWRKHNEQPLTDYHKACVRMVRADYCGNGRSHAGDGPPLEIFDELGIHRAPAGSQANGKVFEAAWTPDGAYCVGRLRADTPIAALLKECPGRFVAETTLGLDDGETCQLRAIKPAQILIRNRSQKRAR